MATSRESALSEPPQSIDMELSAENLTEREGVVSSSLTSTERDIPATQKDGLKSLSVAAFVIDACVSVPREIDTAPTREDNTDSLSPHTNVDSDYFDFEKPYHMSKEIDRSDGSVEGKDPSKAELEINAASDTTEQTDSASAVKVIVYDSGEICLLDDDDRPLRIPIPMTEGYEVRTRPCESWVYDPSQEEPPLPSTVETLEDENKLGNENNIIQPEITHVEHESHEEVNSEMSNDRSKLDSRISENDFTLFDHLEMISMEIDSVKGKTKSSGFSAKEVLKEWYPTDLSTHDEESEFEVDTDTRSEITGYFGVADEVSSLVQGKTNARPSSNVTLRTIEEDDKKEHSNDKMTNAADDLDGSDAYDTDLDVEEEEHRLLGDPIIVELLPPKERYLHSCELLSVTPSQRLLQQIATSEVNMRHRCMNSVEAKTLAEGLMANNILEKLNLAENQIGGNGLYHLADVLAQSLTLRRLCLASNGLGSIGAHIIGLLLKINSSIHHLDISDNGFRDSDANFLADGIEQNASVSVLKMTHNGFSEQGMLVLSGGLGSNDRIEELDLSWNIITRKGAVSLFTALKRNDTMTWVNLANNGLGFDGALAMGQMLKFNKALKYLDVSGNNINWQGARLISNGLKRNKTLQTLKIGNNPLMMYGCYALLVAVCHSKSDVSHISFKGIPVNERLLYQAELVQKFREFQMTHGVVLEGHDVFGRKEDGSDNQDPVGLLITWMSDRGIRPLDLFRAFDKDSSQQVTKQQFIQGLKKVRAPLSNFEIIRAAENLQSDDGHISYSLLVKGVQKQLMERRKKEKERQANQRSEKEKYRRIMQPSTTTGAASTSESQPPSRGASSVSMMTVTTLLGAFSNHRSGDASSMASSKLSTQTRLPTRLGASRTGALPIVDMSRPLVTKDYEMNPDRVKPATKLPKARHQKKRKTKVKGLN